MFSAIRSKFLNVLIFRATYRYNRIKFETVYDRILTVYSLFLNFERSENDQKRPGTMKVFNDERPETPKHE